MDHQQLEKYRHDLEFLRAMAAQAETDFARFGYPLAFNSELPPDFRRYCIELAPRLREWCKSEGDRIRSLLYHIDLPEHMIPEGYGCRDPEALAERILQRELIKVVLRKHFSS
jgi:hypothetical protein